MNESKDNKINDLYDEPTHYIVPVNVDTLLLSLTMLNRRYKYKFLAESKTQIDGGTLTGFNKKTNCVTLDAIKTNKKFEYKICNIDDIVQYKTRIVIKLPKNNDFNYKQDVLVILQVQANENI